MVILWNLINRVDDKMYDKKDLLDEIYIKNIFLEFYFCWENINFMNIEDLIEIGGCNEDIEEVFWMFLECDFGYREIRNVGF